MWWSTALRATRPRTTRGSPPGWSRAPGRSTTGCPTCGGGSRPVPESRASSAQALDHVVDAVGERLDVLGVDGRVQRDPQLVAAQLAVAVGVEHEVLAEDRADRGGLDRGVQ